MNRHLRDQPRNTAAAFLEPTDLLAHHHQHQTHVLVLVAWHAVRWLFEELVVQHTHTHLFNYVAFPLVKIKQHCCLVNEGGRRNLPFCNAPLK